MHERPRVALVLSNQATSPVSGWPIGFWLEELTHPLRALESADVETELFSPDGGTVTFDAYSDPYAEHGYSAHDEISKTFLDDPASRARLDETRTLDELDVADFDAVFLVGGQGPMVTFAGNPAVESTVADFLAAGKPTAVVCHATSVLLTATDADGRLLVEGLRWTGFSDEEERFAEQAAGTRLQPFWIQERAEQLHGTTFVAGPAFESHVIVDGHLITGQQQHSSGAAAEALVEAVS